MRCFILKDENGYKIGEVNIDTTYALFTFFSPFEDAHYLVNYPIYNFYMNGKEMMENKDTSPLLYLDGESNQAIFKAYTHNGLTPLIILMVDESDRSIIVILNCDKNDITHIYTVYEICED